jgi:putative transposase
MARQARLTVDGGLHVLSQRAVSSRAGIPSEVAAAQWLRLLAGFSVACEVRIHAWTLAAFEWRLLCTPRQGAGLSALVQAMGRVYGPWLNVLEGVGGSPWLGRFQSAVIDPLWYLDALAWAEAWGDPGLQTPWSSSVAHHGGQQPCEWLMEHPQHWALGNTPFEREAAYCQMSARPPSLASVSRQAAIRQAVSAGRAAGDAAFLQHVQTQSGRTLVVRPRGRPRRNTKLREGGAH